MPHFDVATAMYFDINGVHLHDHIRSARLSHSVEQRETTGISDKHRSFTAGPSTGQLQVEWIADYHPHSVYRTLYPLLGKTARVQVNPGTPSSLAFTASTPRHRFDVLVTSLPSIDARFGRLSTFTTSWPITGPVVVIPSPYFEAVMTVGAAGSIRGFREGLSGYGSLDPDSAPGEDVPGFTPVQGVNENIDIQRIAYTGGVAPPTANFNFYLVNNADALAVHGHWLVVGPIVLHLDPAPGSDQFYRGRAVDNLGGEINPGWSVGQKVNVELWNGDPR